jgi:hypothetical protein
MYITQEATITHKTSKAKTDETTPKYTSRNKNDKNNTSFKSWLKKLTCLRQVKSESRTYGQWCPNELKFEL